MWNDWIELQHIKVILIVRFQNENRDIKPDTIISTCCSITVLHKIEFTMEPQNCLRIALRNSFENSIQTDVKIIFNKNKEFKLHKSILYARSQKFIEIFDFFDEFNEKENSNEKLKSILKKNKNNSDKKIFFDTSPFILEDKNIKQKSMKNLVKSNLYIEDQNEDSMEDVIFQEQENVLLQPPTNQKKIFEDEQGFINFKIKRDLLNKSNHNKIFIICLST